MNLRERGGGRGTLGGGEEWEPVVGMYYMTEEYFHKQKER